MGNSRPKLLRRGIHNKVTDHLAQHFTGSRNNYPGQYRAKHSAEPNGTSHIPGQERRGHFRDVLEAVAGDHGILWPHHSIDEADREVETVRVFQHAGETLSGCICGDSGTLGEPLLHERDNLGAEVVLRARGGGDGHGHEVSLSFAVGVSLISVRPLFV